MRVRNIKALKVGGVPLLLLCAVSLFPLLSKGFLPFPSLSQAEPVSPPKTSLEYLLMQQIHGIKPHMASELSGLIHEESQRMGLDPYLILGMISVESSFNPRAVSHKGARGLMQIMPLVAKDLAEELSLDPFYSQEILFDPAHNIRIGIHYLAQLVHRFDDLEIALVAYNYGPTYVRDRLAQGHTLPKTYPSKVLKAAQHFKKGLHPYSDLG